MKTRRASAPAKKSGVALLREFAARVFETENKLLQENFNLFEDSDSEDETYWATRTSHLLELLDGVLYSLRGLWGLPEDWKLAKTSPLYEILLTGEAPDAPDGDLSAMVPPGWPGWIIGGPLATQPSMLIKRVCAKNTIPDDEEGETSLKKPRAAKVKKEPLPLRTPRSSFNEKLAALDRTSLIRPWMHTKALRLITKAEDLQEWCDRVLADASNYRKAPKGAGLMPAVAVDTETFGIAGTSGLDTRIVNDEIQADIAGIVLCSDGIESLYVPINHEDGHNVDRWVVRDILQPFFDKCLLLFFNAKFDREIIRNTLHMTLRDYPYFEDVQVLHYINDPKSDTEEDTGSYETNGLKDLAERELNIHQIELKELAGVKYQVINEKGNKCERNTLAPFSWIPTELAVLYAAGDGITTWLLWEKKQQQARSMPMPHKYDHLLIDSLAWVERQRPLIAVEPLKKIVKWHAEKLENYRRKLGALIGVADFNPRSPIQIKAALIDHYKFPIIRYTPKGGVCTDASVIEDLTKMYPKHEFLGMFAKFKEYSALNPQNLDFDPRDNSAKLGFKGCTVAGGRLAAYGGEFLKDGGFGLNPQAIVSVGGNLWIQARRLLLEDTADLGENFNPKGVVTLEASALHPSCFKDGKLRAENLVNNHIARYCGEWWSLAASGPCLFEDGTEIALGDFEKVDANEVVNIRALFIAPEGYTYFTSDYSNIEMRVASNISKEPKFIDEFLTGSGDFHTLTALNVFPEFRELRDKIKVWQEEDPKGGDPAIQSAIAEAKGKMKSLRGLAKVINFALLYGGTEYAIYDGMVKQDPTITKEKAGEMVEAYWRGVPMFYEWAQRMQLRARDKMECITPSGRRIDFASDMRTKKIYVPNTGDYSRYQDHWGLKRESERHRKRDPEKADELEEKARQMYLDKATGVANYGDYRSFMGKIQRVATNAPLQGLAGDFMRVSLSNIRQWAERVAVGKILMMHATVHDEVDYSIKNEYVPYVLPRIVRCMKLRKMHSKMGWPVPIECDTEYGKSWDVKEHLTGDDTHSPSGYTKITGLENYIPDVFDKESIEAVIAALLGEDPLDKEDALTYLTSITHERVHGTIQRLTKANAKDIRLFVTAILQLHEYWVIEHGEPDDVNDESIEDYEKRNGLDPNNRPSQWTKFPRIPVRLAEPDRMEGDAPASVDPVDMATPPTPDPWVEEDATELVEEPEIPSEVTPPEGLDSLPPDEDTLEDLPTPEDDEQDEQTPDSPPEGTDMQPVTQDGLLVIRPLSREEWREFQSTLGLGKKRFKFLMDLPNGKRCMCDMPKVAATEIDTKYLLMEPVNV